MYYDISALNREAGPYSKTVTGASSTETLQFQFCATFEDGSYGWITESSRSIADDAVNSIDSSNLRDAEEEINGVSFTQDSDTVCIEADAEADPEVEEVNYSMISKITCDEAITEAGNPTISSVSVSDNGCVYTVAMSHAAGCTKGGVDIDAAMGWLYENEWAIGIIYLIAGPLIALFGTGWFPYVVAAIVAIFVIGIVCSISLAAGWMATGLGTGIVFAVALILGVIGGILIRRNVKVAIGLLGAVGGFFAGTLLFALIASMSSWEAVWGFWMIAVTMAIVGFLVSCKFGKGIVLLSTSMIGSYLFMRSWTMFFPGHWPSEAQLMQPDELETDAAFWIFFSIFVVGFIGAYFFQKNYQDEHEDLDAYEKQD